MEQSYDPLEKFNYMDQGGKLPCPWCKEGFISKESVAVYRCDSCKKAIVGRIKLEFSDGDPVSMIANIKALDS